MLNNEELKAAKPMLAMLLLDDIGKPPSAGRTILIQTIEEMIAENEQDA